MKWREKPKVLSLADAEKKPAAFFDPDQLVIAKALKARLELLASRQGTEK
jgi:hypothetical protein